MGAHAVECVIQPRDVFRTVYFYIVGSPKRFVTVRYLIEQGDI